MISAPNAFTGLVLVIRLMPATISGLPSVSSIGQSSQVNALNAELLLKFPLYAFTLTLARCARKLFYCRSFSRAVRYLNFDGPPGSISNTIETVISNLARQPPTFSCHADVDAHLAPSASVRPRISRKRR